MVFTGDDPEVKVPEEIRLKAKAAVDKMLEMGGLMKEARSQPPESESE